MLDSKKPNKNSFTQVNETLFYSNDTDAHLVFLPHEQEEFEFNEATVALYNLDDESLVERPAVIETFEGRKSVVLKMTEDLLAHWGRWQAQVVFKQGDKINTSVVVKFDTMRYMLDQRPPTLRDVIKVDELYSQLVTVMDEIVGKDVISAPEIILARGGHETLGDRLDEEHNEVAPQLAQIAEARDGEDTLQNRLARDFGNMDDFRPDKVSMIDKMMDEFGERALNVKWFGAKGDGVTDDGQAIKLAHEFANSTGQKVLYPAGTYYLYEVSNIPIMTDVDASKAEIIINPSFEPTRSMFDINPTESKYQIYPELSTLVVNKNTTRLPQITGHGDAILELINDNKRVYIRYGANANTGSPQTDRVVIDTHGNLKNDIVWDYDEVTRVYIQPIDKEFINVIFGRITYMNNIDRTSYAYKNIQVKRSRVNLTVMDEGLVPLAKKSPYAGVIQTGVCAYVTIKDSNLESKPTVKNTEGVSVGTYGLLLQGTISLTLINVRSKEIPDEFDGWGIMGGNVLKDFKVIDCDLSRIDSHQATHNITIENTTVGKHGCTLTGSGTLKMSNVKFSSANILSLRSDYGSTWDGDIVLTDVEHTPHASTAQPAVISATPILTHEFGYPCHFGRSITIKNYKVTTDYMGVISVLKTNLYKEANPINKYILPDVINLENLKTSNNAKRLRVFGLPMNNYLDFSTNTEGSYQVVEGETRIVSNIEMNIYGGDWIETEDFIGWDDYRTNAFSQGHESYQPTSPYPTININNVSNVFLDVLAHAYIVNIYGGSVKRIYAENGGGSRGVITAENSDINTNGANYGIRLPKNNSSYMRNCMIYPPMDGESMKSTASDIIRAHDAVWGQDLSYINPRPNIINCILSNDYPISIVKPNWEDYMMPILNMKSDKAYHPKRGTLSNRPTVYLEVGDTYFNTDTNTSEVWTGTDWV